MRSLILTILILFSFRAQASPQCRSILSTPLVAPSRHETIQASLRVLDTLKNEGLIKPKDYKHAKEDLEAGEEQIQKKAGHASFDQILEKWSKYLSSLEAQLTKYKKLTATEQKVWRSKLQLALFFGVGHFVTFLESSNPNVYSKINSILSHMNTLPTDLDSKVFLFELEKQVLKYFSIKEFVKCRF